MDISGKVAIVTGGAGGIGKAMIEILLQKNAKVSYIYAYHSGSFIQVHSWQVKF